jgi:hypothetical protein
MYRDIFKTSAIKDKKTNGDKAEQRVPMTDCLATVRAN